VILRRIEINNLCKFTQPVVLADLPDGLVVIPGDNEDGKSTLLTALRAAFFYKHSWGGARIDELQPYGSATRPEVAVEFDHEGARYRLSKGFGQRKFCELAGAARRWSGDEAEEELARLLGASVPGRATDRDYEGPLGLLWLQQGGAWSSLISESGRGGLRRLLEQEVGEVLGGPRAQQILKAAEGMRGGLLTPTGKPTGALKSLGEQELELQRRRDGLQAKLNQHERLREQMAASLAQLQAGRSQLPGLADQLRDAERRGEEAGRLQTRVRELNAQLDAERQRAARLDGDRVHRQRLGGELEKARSEVGRRNSALEAAQQGLEVADGASGAAQRATITTADELGRAEQQRAAILRALERGVLQQRSDELASQLKMARDADQRRRQSLTEAVETGMDLKSLPELRRLHAAMQAAVEAESVAATRVSAKLHEGARLQLNGEALGAEWSGTIAARSQLEIAAEGVVMAEITIVPAASVGELAAQHQTSRRAWDEAAGRHGVATLAEAERQWDKRQRAEQLAALAEKDRDRYAPTGLEQLELDTQVIAGQLGQLLDGEGDSRTAAELSHARGEVESALEAARTLAATAAQQAVVALQVLEHAQSGVGTAAGELERAQENMEARAAELAALEQDSPAAALRQQLEDAEQRSRRLEAELAPMQHQLDELDLPGVMRQQDRARRAHDHLQTDIRQLEKAADQQRGQLSAAEAWDEELQGVAAELEWVALRHAELERRAASAKLLCEVLQAAKSGAEERFIAPVKEQVEPLLKKLIPGAEMQIDTGMNVTGLRRAGCDEPYERLSLGTREQLAILVRLGFAGVLRARGQAAITILDDAPVYADAQRFAAMLAILDDAAQGGQILVLTCREQEFRPSGAAIRRLQSGAGAHVAAGG